MNQNGLSQQAINLLHEWEAPYLESDYIKFQDIGDGKLTIGAGIAFSKGDPKIIEIKNALAKMDENKDKIGVITNEIKCGYDSKFKGQEVKYSTFGSLPQGGKELLILLAYNVGASKLINQYKKLLAYLSEGYFKQAVLENGRTSSNPNLQNGLQNRTHKEQNYLLGTFDENGQ